MKRIFERMDNVRANIFLLALLFVFIFSLPPAKAQVNTTGVQVSPVRFDWDMNSGDERTGVVNLKNYSDKPYNVEVQIEDFYVSDDSSDAQFFVPNSGHPLIAYDVINWIDAPKTITLAPAEGKDIFFHVKVPQETPTGGYYGAVFFKTNAGETGNQGSKILINQRVGVLLIMAVKGSQPIHRAGEISNFRPLRKIFWDKPAQFSADYTNSGNIHFKVSGAIDLYNFGRKIKALPIDARVAYPGRVRKYENSWDFSPWAYGYYTAKINLISEDGAIASQKQYSFFVIPWKTTAAIIIILLVLWLLIKLLGKKFEIKRK